MKLTRSKGQALIEMALLLPFLLLLILATFDFGRLFYMKIVMTNAAREGVSYLSHHPTDDVNCEISNPLICYLGSENAIQLEGESSGLTVARSEITYVIQNPGNGPTPGEWVQVEIRKTPDLIFDGFLTRIGLISGPLQLKSIARMVVQ